MSDRQRVDERRLNASARTSAGRTSRSNGLVKEAAYGKTVWSWHPWLVSNRRRLFEPDGLRSTANSPMTEARGIRLRGELGISRKAIAQGRPDALRWTCMLVCALLCAHCTRDRGCSAHPVFPAPSRWRERNFSKPRAQGVARRRNCIHRHCERSEAIHCHLLHGKMDCFASLAMTEKAAAGDLSAVAQRAKADPVSKQAAAYWMPRLHGA